MTNPLHSARLAHSALTRIAWFAVFFLAVWSSTMPALAQDGQSESSIEFEAPITGPHALGPHEPGPGPINSNFSLERLVLVRDFSPRKLVVTKWNYAWERQVDELSKQTTTARVPKKELEIEVPTSEITAWDLKGNRLSKEQLITGFAKHPFAVVLTENKPPEISPLHQAALHPNLVFVYHTVLENADPPIP